MEQVCNEETETNVRGFVFTQPVVYFTTITDFYQFRRINKCHNLVNPCHICTYLQDPLLVQQFRLAAKFSVIQNRRIEFCCSEYSHYFDSQELIHLSSHELQCIHRQDATQCGNIHYTIYNLILPQATRTSSCCVLASIRFFRWSNRRSRSNSFILKI